MSAPGGSLPNPALQRTGQKRPAAELWRWADRSKREVKA